MSLICLFFQSFFRQASKYHNIEKNANKKRPNKDNDKFEKNIYLLSNQNVHYLETENESTHTITDRPNAKRSI